MKEEPDEDEAAMLRMRNWREDDEAGQRRSECDRRRGPCHDNSAAGQSSFTVPAAAAVVAEIEVKRSNGPPYSNGG